MRRTFFLLAVFTACGRNPTVPPPPAPPQPSVCGHRGALTVHEWGTYTSVHASDGHALGGLHHEDEKLPSWVHRREFSPQSYYFEQLPEEPLEQLETPVLYFYAPERTDVTVDVSFPLGIVGEWYPEALSFSPPLQGMTELAQGAMRWSVTLDPALPPSQFMPVSPDEIWAPSRNVASTPVQQSATNESERFIFYRGLAKFEPQLHTAVATDGTLTLTNTSAQDLPAVFVLRASDTQGAFVNLGPLAAGQSITAPTPALASSLSDFLTAAREGARTALGRTGLCADEAQAMVDTWTRSWFKNVGLRVLYVAPRPWADGWLPMQVTPAPDEVVRTLVGRVELITPSEEAALAAQVEAAAASGGTVSLTPLGRFAEPRLNRALEQVTSPGAVDLARSLRDQVHATP